ncbi:PE-PPE domain-containing protein [Mycobacterium sp. ML4]
MSYLTTQPQLMSAAAENLAGIRASLAEASAAAAGPTTGLAAAAADEISAAAAQLFGAFGQEYQQVIGQATVFHEEFNRALGAASLAYVEAEVANAAQVLGGAGGGFGAAASPIEALLAPVLAPLQPLLSPVQSLLAPLQSLFGAPATPTGGGTPVSGLPTPTRTYELGLFMTGSGTPIPSLAYMDSVRPWVTAGFNLNNPLSFPLNTPEGLYPLTQIKDLPLNQSITTGVQALHNALFSPTGYITNDQSVSVLGYSQSAILSSIELRNLIASGITPQPDLLSFTLLGNPMAPNGGLLARFPGLSLPALGLDFYGATPANSGYPVNMFSLQYDGYTDFPKYPINLLSDLNAFLGIQTVHGDYPQIDPNNLPPGYHMVELPVSPTTAANNLDHYYMITSPDVPLVSTIKSIPFIGTPLADLLGPNLTYLINWGYGDPNFGYNTGYADVPTPFEVLPPIPANFVGDQVALAGVGLNAFAHDLGAPALPSPASLASLVPAGGSGGLSLPFTLPGATSSPVNSFFDAIKAANTNITTAITSATADAYALALPTTDILNTLVTTVPSYNLNLFLDGIQQTFNGDPMGLFNAIGKPIAADVAIGTLAAGFEYVVFSDTVSSVIGDLTGTG